MQCGCWGGGGGAGISQFGWHALALHRLVHDVLCQACIAHPAHAQSKPIASTFFNTVSTPFPHPAAAVQSLRESAMPTLESLKLSLATRDENELVARSVNRPADAVQLSTSNLPGVNWVSPASGEAAGAGAAASYAAAAAASSGMAGYMQGVPAPEPMAPSAPPAPPAQVRLC